MERSIIRKQESRKGNLRDFLTVFFKYRVKILVIFFSVVFTVTLITFLLPPVYETNSSLLVKFGREYLNLPDVGTTSPATRVDLDKDAVVNSEVQILTSPDLAKRVIETLKIENIYPDLAETPQKDIKPIDAAVHLFGKNLVVSGVRKSSVIRVSFRHKDPQVAARAVNLLVECFREKHLQVFSGPQSSFLEGQVSALRQKLVESENNLQSFKQKNRVYALDEQRSLLLKQRTDLATELMTSQNSIDELQKRLSSLKTQTRNIKENKAFYTATDRDKIIEEANSKLLALELSEQDLLRKYREENRLVVDTRKQIQHVKNFIREQEAEISAKTVTGNAVYQEAQKDLVKTEADLSAQRAKLSTLSTQLGKLDGEIQALDLREKDMQNLKREQATNEKNFQIYGDKMAEARIMDEMDRLKMANISVIQPAVVPVKPVSPRRKLNIAMGVFLGSLAGIGFALFSEKNSQGLVTPEMAERRLNLAVLAAIPYKEGNHVRQLL